MARRNRLTSSDDSFISLRAEGSGTHPSFLNMLVLGLAVTHLVEREYGVYIRTTPSRNEVTMRIYNQDERYELVVYGHEDWRIIFSDAMKRLGGQKDFDKLVGYAHQISRLAEKAGEASRTESEG